MGFLKKLLGIGATAGATVAAMKVAERYQANNPDGVQDCNGDGKVDTHDVLAEVKKAASEVYNDAAAAVQQKAPEYIKKATAVVNDVFDKKA